MNNCITCNKLETHYSEFEHWTCDRCKPSCLYLLVCKACMKKVYHGGDEKFRDIVWTKAYDEHNENEIHGAVSLV